MEAHGYSTLTLPGGRVIERDTHQCPHCGGHWEIVKGSGRPHVFCSRCNANTCSKPACLRECVPIEKQLDEAGKPGRILLPPGFSTVV